MAAANTAQPFWTSKTFWTLLLGGVYNLLSYFHALPASLDAPTFVNTVVMILGIFFRWTADQPLTTNAAAIVEPPAAH